MDLKTVSLTIPEGTNIVVGQSHFIKTVEDMYEIMVTAVPGAQFGIAFNEASGPCLIRSDGTDRELVEIAVKNCRAMQAGHVFNLGHGINQFANPEHAKVFVDAVHELSARYHK